MLRTVSKHALMLAATAVIPTAQCVLDANSPLVKPPKEHKEVKVDPKLFDGYVGRYQLTPSFSITITREGDHLLEQATAQPKFEIFPESDRDYFLKVDILCHRKRWPRHGIDFAPGRNRSTRETGGLEETNLCDHAISFLA
jgi:hypothetical protein